MDIRWINGGRAGACFWLSTSFPANPSRGFALISFWPLAPPGWPATVMYLRRSCLRPPCQTGGGAELPADWQRPADVSQSGRHTWGHGWSAISPALAFRAPTPSSHHPASSLASDTNKAAGCGPPEVPPKMDAQSPPPVPRPPVSPNTRLGVLSSILPSLGPHSPPPLCPLSPSPKLKPVC